MFVHPLVIVVAGAATLYLTRDDRKVKVAGKKKKKFSLWPFGKARKERLAQARIAGRRHRAAPVVVPQAPPKPAAAAPAPPPPPEPEPEPAPEPTPAPRVRKGRRGKREESSE